MEISRRASSLDDATKTAIVFHRPIPGMVALGVGQHCVSCLYPDGAFNLSMGYIRWELPPHFLSDPTLSSSFTTDFLLGRCISKSSCMSAQPNPVSRKAQRSLLLIDLDCLGRFAQEICIRYEYKGAALLLVT